MYNVAKDMKHLKVFTFLLLFFVLFVFTKVNAGYNCIPDPDDPTVTRCIEDAVSPYNLKECLQGGVVYVPASACKDDPRYHLRNFAPFLNFPNIGSMLNLGTGLVTVVAGLLCGIFMFSGVFKYLTAGGEAKKIESARSRMVFAGIGLLIVLFAYTIVKLILDTTSTNTVGF